MVTDEDEDNGGSSGDILTIKKCLNDGTWTNSTIVCCMFRKYSFVSSSL